MDRRDQVSGSARLELTIDPPWLLAPLFLRDFVQLQRIGPGPGNLIDRVPVRRTDMQGMLRAVQMGRVVQLTAAAADWRIWWTMALDHPPSAPPPVTADLIGFSAALTELWREVGDTFRQWSAKRRAPDPGPAPEFELLAGRSAGTRPTTAGTLGIVVVPVTGNLFVRPEPDRLVVAAELRRDRLRYADLLEPVLAEYF